MPVGADGLVQLGLVDCVRPGAGSHRAATVEDQHVQHRVPAGGAGHGGEVVRPLVDGQRVEQGAVDDGGEAPVVTGQRGDVGTANSVSTPRWAAALRAWSMAVGEESTPRTS